MNTKRKIFSFVYLRALLLFGLIFVASLSAPAVLAGGVVSDCSNNTQFLAAVSGGGTVIFACSGTITVTSTINITSNTTIDGAGQNVTISGGNINNNGLGGVFSIASSGTLTVTNLTIANGVAASGGAIYVNSGATLNLINSALSDNGSSFSGGAIANISGTVIINGSTLSENNALTLGGAIYSSGGSLTITNSSFLTNTATSAGGAIFVNSTAQISDSAFSNNSSSSTQFAGGAIFNSGTLMVDNVTFSNNRTIPVGSHGGAIANRAMLTVKNSTFNNNIAPGHGGAIAFNFETNANTTVTYSVFSGNRGETGGGALVNFGATLLVADSSFNGNYALGAGVGGAIRNASGTMTVARSTFYNNNAGAGSSSGGAIRNGGTLHLSNSTFALNSAYSGGGLYNTGTANVINNTFSGNTASFGGGGIRNDSNLTLTNTIVVNSANGNCSEQSGMADGGGNITWPNTDTSCPSVKVDPELGLLQNNGGTTQTMMPASTSEAIDRNDSAACAGSPLDGIDQRGRARNADGNGAASANECDSGAVEYHATAPAQNCALTEDTDIVVGDITFNIASDGIGDLACIKVEDMGAVNHPLATSGIATGHWWHIYGEDSAGRRVTSGFTLAVTLPFTGADANSRVCKHPGNLGGAGWDCGDETDNMAGTNAVTRAGITGFSAFAVGDNVGPTAVSLSSFSAKPNLQGLASLVGFVALILLGAMTAVALRRRVW
jgi:predicted outer membrane repeat protein